MDLHARRRPDGRWTHHAGPPSSEAWERHRSGQEELGFLPVRRDGTVAMLAVESERSTRLPCWREGGRLWLAFADPLPLATARALARHLGGRLDPTQPAPLPRGEVPLVTREQVDEALADPRWGPLPLARREEPSDAEWDDVTVVLREHVEVRAPAEVEGFLRRAFTFLDPRGRRLVCAGRAGDRVVAPRGAWDRLREHLEMRRIPYRVEDLRLAGPRRPLRRVDGAMEEVLRRDGCLLHAEDGMDVALAVMARRGVPTLVIVRRRARVEAWSEALRGLGLEPGLIAGGEARLGDFVTVASYGALAGHDLSDLGRYLGQVVLDECHRAPLSAVVDILRQLPARHALGLMPAPRRPDGLQRVLYAWLGEVVRTGPPRPRVRLEVRPDPATLPLDVEDWTAGGGLAMVLARRRSKLPGVVSGRASALAALPRPDRPVTLFVVDPPASPADLKELVSRVDRVVDYADLRTPALERRTRRRMALYRHLLGEEAVPDLPRRPKVPKPRKKRESADQMLLDF